MQIHPSNSNQILPNSFISAALLIIGDEILSGRTEDKNLNFLAKSLNEIGINLKEVQIVGDVESQIIESLNNLRAKYNYVFTSGGIGPTHDDITSLSVSKAFNDVFEKNLEAEQILFNHYGKENVNEARLKMAFLPRKAKLLENSISSAPGFIVENVFVMAGVPKIFQAMFEAAKKHLISGNKTYSIEIKTFLTESAIAKEFANLQQKYPQIAMGSYPGIGQTSLVFRGINYEEIETVSKEMNNIILKIEVNKK